MKTKLLFLIGVLFLGSCSTRKIVSEQEFLNSMKTVDILDVNKSYVSKKRGTEKLIIQSSQGTFLVTYLGKDSILLERWKP